MEPRIQYAKTSDGVNIAYAVFGDGPPVVFPVSIFGDLHLYSSLPASPFGSVTDRLVAFGWRVIRYDDRGTGSSDRDVADFSLEARLRDLEAVTERAALQRFAVCGRTTGGLVAIAYAARYPQRLSQLVLSGTFASGADFYKVVPFARTAVAMSTLAEKDWEYYSLAVASAATGFADSALARELAAAFRSGMSASAYLAHLQAGEKIDVTDLLPLVEAPTLVVEDRASATENADLSRAVASQIANARLVATDDYPRAVDEFLRETGEYAPSAGAGISPPAAPVPAEPDPERGQRVELPTGLTAILFADIADSTALTERLGDTAFREKARDLDGVLRTIIRDNAGTPIEGKLLGDGVLAVFTSARQAIEAALACGEQGNREGLPLHLGLHAGDVIRESDPDGRSNVYGGAVNIASRISGLSAPGEVLVSETVRSLARTSAGVGFEDRGEQALKGGGEAVRLFAVSARNAKAELE